MYSPGMAASESDPIKGARLPLALWREWSVDVEVPRQEPRLKRRNGKSEMCIAQEEVVAGVSIIGNAYHTKGIERLLA